MTSLFDDGSSRPNSDLLEGLNPVQHEAVIHSEGPLLIIAGAGSGKTRVLTQRIAHLIRDLGISPFEILAITFTNKAAGEMKERVAALVGPVAEKMWVSTFHSACVRILRRDGSRLGFPSSFTIYDQSDAERLTGYCVRDLGLDQPTIDPTSLDGEELVAEVQRIVKALLAYGAKLPKELMLYIKNMVFLDGAIARLAPNLDIIGELTNISFTFMQRHGARLSEELGVDMNAVEIDMGSLKAGLGVDESTESMTYRQLQERRNLIQKRMRDHITN